MNDDQIKVINKSDYKLYFVLERQQLMNIIDPGSENYLRKYSPNPDSPIDPMIKLTVALWPPNAKDPLPGRVYIAINTTTGKITEISPSSLGCAYFDVTSSEKEGQILTVGNLRKRLKVVNKTDTDFTERKYFSNRELDNFIPIPKQSIRYLDISERMIFSTRDIQFYSRLEFDTNNSIINVVTNHKNKNPNGFCLSDSIGAVYIRWENNPDCGSATLYIEPSSSCSG